jgi:RecA/RadA recombinase
MLYWPQGHGVNLDRLKVLAPPTGQHVVDLVDGVIRDADKLRCGLIIVDSLAHIVSQEELNKLALDGDTIGRNAKLLNSAWRKWVSAINDLRARRIAQIRDKLKLGADDPIPQDEQPVLPTILAINQLRSKVGVVMGNPDVTPGGRGQEFATSLDISFSAGQDTYVVWNEKKSAFEARQKGYKSTFKSPADKSPDFIQVNYRVMASGICPKGRSGSFNYWLQPTHGHRVGDPDNGFQLWNYAKTYLLKQDGPMKSIEGTELSARTLDELEKLFRADLSVQERLYPVLLDKLCKSDAVIAPDAESTEAQDDDAATEI